MVRYQREWTGVPGYVNCLLTAMAEGAADSVELFAKKPVPNLIELAAHNSDLKAWLVTLIPEYAHCNKNFVGTRSRNRPMHGGASWAGGAAWPQVFKQDFPSTCAIAGHRVRLVCIRLQCANAW